jgi:hypothetical protein
VIRGHSLHASDTDNNLAVRFFIDVVLQAKTDNVCDCKLLLSHHVDVCAKRLMNAGITEAASYVRKAATVELGRRT